MDGYTITTHTAALISLASFLFGVLMGHRFNLWRDRRNEFKKHVEPIILRLLTDRENPSPFADAITSADEYLTTQMLPVWRRSGFNRACASYRNAKSQNQEVTGYGGIGYSTETEIVTHIDSLLLHLKRK